MSPPAAADVTIDPRIDGQTSLSLNIVCLSVDGSRMSYPQVAPRANHDVRSGSDAVVVKLLDLARSHVGMDLMWVSSFHGDDQIIDIADGDAAGFGLFQGTVTAISDTYCARVLDGRLQNVVPDTLANPVSAELEMTASLSVGSYIGVPIIGRDGEPSGMLSGISRETRHDIEDTDVRFLELLADAVVALGDDSTTNDRNRRIRERVGRVLQGGVLTSAYQPVVALSTGRIVGAEALARFAAEPARPDVWFAEAASVGMGRALELAAVHEALRGLDALPADAYLAINASPDLICSEGLHALLSEVDADRIVVELTEHVAVDDYETLLERISHLRSLGVRLAIDDVGAGFSSFNHVLRLAPDIIKLDISITRDIHTDLARRGLARGLLSVAHDIGATVVAEGIETHAELDTLFNLGVDAGQGYYLARPAPLPLPLATAVPRPTPRLVGDRESVGNHDDALGFLARAWMQGADLEAVTRPMLDAILDRTGLETSYLTIRDPKTGALEHRFVRNAGTIALPEGMVVPWDDTLCKRCRDADIKWTADVPADLPGCDAADALRVQTFLSIPLFGASGEEFGTLCAASTEARYIGSSMIAEIELMAQLIGTRHAP